jgi:hypothetical protein
MTCRDTRIRGPVWREVRGPDQPVHGTDPVCRTDGSADRPLTGARAVGVQAAAGRPEDMVARQQVGPVTATLGTATFAVLRQWLSPGITPASRRAHYASVLSARQRSMTAGSSRIK